jgi:23S rRNA (adenine2030-N6)-methyltransferase
MPVSLPDARYAVMLSYLHGFHAGNHADVLKHVVLVSILTRLIEKTKPVRYIETHAGAGGYDLRSAAAQKNREYANGIGRLIDVDDAPAAVARLVDLVRLYNRGLALHYYPGSPQLVSSILRANDRLYLFELHGAEHAALTRKLGADRRVTALREDGLRGCIGLVPPPERRALLFVDPSYEVKDEHERVVAALTNAHRRFATGVYAVWYPVIDRRWVGRLERAVRAQLGTRIALYELCVQGDGHGRGLTGSGMIVVNPPWTLDDDMRAALPWLAEILAIDDGSHRLVPAAES